MANYYQYFDNSEAGQNTRSEIKEESAFFGMDVSQDIDCNDVECRDIDCRKITATSTIEGTAATFSGLLTANSASANVKAFNIPHPTKDGKRLWHGCLEGPEYAVYVRGRLTGDDSIILPDYWNELVHEDTITVQLQPIGVNQDIVVKEWNLEKVVLSSSTPIDCFYTITGTRKDVPLLEVEQDS